MPAPDKLGGKTFKEVVQIGRGITAVVGHCPLQWMVRPAPRVLVVKHVVTQPRQTDRIGQIIPRDAADRILRYHAGHNDPEARLHRIPKCPRPFIIHLATLANLSEDERRRGKLQSGFRQQPTENTIGGEVFSGKRARCIAVDDVIGGNRVETG